MWILIYLFLIVLVSVIIYLGTLVFVNRDAIFYKSKNKNNVENRIEDKKQKKFDVISRAEKIESVRQRTVPLSVVDQTVFTYKPSFDSQVTKKIYDFLASLEDKSEKWVLYTYNNERLNGYIYPSLKGFSPTKKLSEYNPENRSMNVILVFKEYMSYVEPIEYLNRLGNSKYFIPTMDDKHDSVFESGCEFDVSKDVNDIFINDVRDIDTLDNVEFQRAYFKIRSLKDFLKVREMCVSKYDIHYDSASVIHVEKSTEIIVNK